MGSEQAVSQELLEARADALLTEWGEWQRKEPRVGPRQGRHPIAAAMEDYARRSKSRRCGVAWRKRRRLIDLRMGDDGKVRWVPVLPMSPDRVCKQSRGGPRVAEPWPAHVMAIDRALATLPPGLQAVARVYYIEQRSIRDGADVLRITRATFSARLELVRWFLIGRLSDIDGGDA